MGIKPTKSVAEIKKAYASAVKLHHPEDDPEGFQTVKRAYEQALSYAKGISHGQNNPEAGFVSQKPIITQPAPEKDSSAWRDLFQKDLKIPKNQDTSQTSTDKKTQQPKEPLELFDNVDGIIEQENERKKQLIVKALNQAKRYYMVFRNCAKVWYKYFHSKSFLSLQNDPVFTASLLDFIESNRKMHSGVYNKVFLPTLREWALLWAGSELERQFVRLSQPMERNSRRIPEIKPAIRYLAFILTSSIMFFGLIYLISDAKTRYNVEESSSYPFFLSDYDAESESSVADEQETPSQAEQQSQTEFTEALDKVKQGIYENKPYSELRAECESIQIAEKNYNILLADYREYGKEFVETVLDAYFGIG